VGVCGLATLKPLIGISQIGNPSDGFGKLGLTLKSSFLGLNGFGEYPEEKWENTIPGLH